MFSKPFPISSSLAARAAIASASLAALAGLAGTVSAGVIYQDNFARGTPTSQLALSGSTPAPTDVPGAVWVAYSNPTTDGTELNYGADASGGYQMGVLPIAPVYGDGQTYALFATITTSNDLLGLGFGPKITNPNFTANTSLSFQYVNAGGYEQAFTHSTGNLVGSYQGTAGAATVGVTLNDNTGLLDFYAQNGSSFATATLSSTQVNSIKTVYVTQFGTGLGTISNFSVTGPVPEPSALGLLALGGLGLLLLKRRKTA